MLPGWLNRGGSSLRGTFESLNWKTQKAHGFCKEAHAEWDWKTQKVHGFCKEAHAEWDWDLVEADGTNSIGSSTWRMAQELQTNFCIIYRVCRMGACSVGNAVSSNFWDGITIINCIKGGNGVGSNMDCSRLHQSFWFFFCRVVVAAAFSPAATLLSYEDARETAWLTSYTTSRWVVGC
ncbi:hypothetical protein L7F22_062215 [Adiantum nelumboides]|nr:hypothetical protein [Adiantum nelumboides]